MARGFGRFFGNPERRIENEGNFTQTTKSDKFDVEEAREANDTEGIKRISQMRRILIGEMDYDELNYKIKKLQNSQRLSPSPEKVKQIVELKKELEALEQGVMTK